MAEQNYAVTYHVVFSDPRDLDASDLWRQDG